MYVHASESLVKSILGLNYSIILRSVCEIRELIPPCNASLSSTVEMEPATSRHI